MTDGAPRTRTRRAGRGRHRSGLGLLRSGRHRARRSARPSSAPALTGRTAQVMGDPDQPHSYSYTPDVAAGAHHPRHRSPAPPARSGTCRSPRPAPPGRSSTAVYGLAGHRPRSFAAGRTTLRLLGLVKPAMREYLHTLYQFTDRWVVDDSQVPRRVRRPRPPRSTTPWPPPSRGTGDAARRPPPRRPARPTHDPRRSARCTRLNRPRRAAPPPSHGRPPPCWPSPASPPSVRSSTTRQILKDADRRDPRPLPRAPGRRHRLVPRARHQRRPAGPRRHLPRPHRRRDPRAVDRRHRHRRRHRPGHRPLPLGAARPRHQRRRPRAGRTADAHHRFELLHTWLGNVLGETIGYALTATFTVLVVIALTRTACPPAG